MATRSVDSRDISLAYTLSNVQQDAVMSSQVHQPPQSEDSVGRDTTDSCGIRSLPQFFMSLIIICLLYKFNLNGRILWVHAYATPP